MIYLSVENRVYACRRAPTQAPRGVVDTNKSRSVYVDVTDTSLGDSTHHLDVIGRVNDPEKLFWERLGTYLKGVSVPEKPLIPEIVPNGSEATTTDRVIYAIIELLEGVIPHESNSALFAAAHYGSEV